MIVVIKGASSVARRHYCCVFNKLVEEEGLRIDQIFIVSGSEEAAKVLKESLPEDVRDKAISDNELDDVLKLVQSNISDVVACVTSVDADHYSSTLKLLAAGVKRIMVEKPICVTGG